MVNRAGLFDTNGTGTLILVATISPRRRLIVFKIKGN